MLAAAPELTRDAVPSGARRLGGAPQAAIVEGVARVDCEEPMANGAECLDELRYGRMAVLVKPGVLTIANLRPDYSRGR